MRIWYILGLLSAVDFAEEKGSPGDPKSAPLLINIIRTSQRKKVRNFRQVLKQWVARVCAFMCSWARSQIISLVQLYSEIPKNLSIHPSWFPNISSGSQKWSSSNKQSPIKRRLRELLRSVSEAAFRSGKYKNKPGGNCRNIPTGRMVTQGLRCSLNRQPLFYADMLDGVESALREIGAKIVVAKLKFGSTLINALFSNTAWTKRQFIPKR